MEAISKRLALAAGLAAGTFAPGARRVVADIGTDHAYLPVYMVSHGLADAALAADVRKGPLERARRHVAEAGLEEKITCRLSDGLAQIRPGEADVYVICGMGGPLIQRLLTQGRGCLLKGTPVVAGPQSELRDFRAFLQREGWITQTERMLEENGKFYTLFLLRAGEEKPKSGQESFSELQLRYGKELLEKRDPVLYKQLLWERRIQEQIEAKLTGRSGSGATARRRQLEKDKMILEEAFTWYDRGE